MDVTRVGSLLSKIDGVVRADKHRWGFADWIDDQYGGIPAEIMQRIEEDGGSTRLNRLLDEIPRFFGVSEMSVRSALASPAFRVEHGWVRTVENPAIDLGTLEDVATGRETNGDLYWAFTVYERYLRGFSITGVPPELAVALGCNFGQTVSIGVQAPHGVQAISVIWRKTSASGPEIGRVSQPLRALRARDGDLIALIVHSDATVSLAHRDMSNADHASSANHIRDDATSSSNSREDGDGYAIAVRVMKPIGGRLEIPPRNRPDPCASA